MRRRNLRLRLRALFRRRAVDRELDEELAFHIECEVRKRAATGENPAEARRRALAQFGSVLLVADRCRDERGITVIDTLARDFRFALRTLRRAPVVALTVVSTIALGLGIISVAFTFFNALFFRVDAVRDPEELYSAERPTHPGSRDEIPFTRLEYEALRRDTDVFVDVAASRPSLATRIDGRAARGMLVSGNFFEMLGTGAARGRTLTEADNEGGGRAAVVLSHVGWEKLFGADPAVIGRQFLLNGRPYEVVGVMPEDFRGLAGEPQDYWAPLAIIEQIRPGTSPNEARVDVIGRLVPGTSPEAAAGALTAWASAQAGIRKPESGIVQVVLRERRGVISEHRGEAMLMFMPIFLAFGLILLIGCANVANLLLARGVSRQREIGVRLSIGATRGQIVRQLLTENVILAVSAAGLGFVISRALLTGGIHLALGILPPEFVETMDVVVPPADWRVAAFLLAGALTSTLMFGLAPALHATRVELVRAMRGELSREARPGRLRHVLIGSQVTASAVLLVCAAVFLRSAYSAATADAGVRTDDTVVITGMTESARSSLLREIAHLSSVAAVAASQPLPVRGGPTAEATAAGTTLGVGCRLVSPEYFDLLGITVLRGRLFAPTERGVGAGVVVISDTVAQRFWPGGGAVGQTMRVGGAALRTTADGLPRASQPFIVVGVVRDVHSALRAVNLTYSGIYLPTTTEEANTSLVLRVQGDPDEARRTLLDALTKIDPAIGEISTMRMMAQVDTAVLQVLFWMAVILGSLALALTVTGLFGVLSYLIEQRRREIGVRMALGARPRDIVVLVVSQSMRPIGTGVIVGGGLAVAVASALLASPMAEMMSAFVRPFDPLAYAAGLGVIVVTCLVAAGLPARRAARINTAATLRAE